jgi:hypothetical protein
MNSKTALFVLVGLLRNSVMLSVVVGGLPGGVQKGDPVYV